ncbi:Uu.00g006570.m01.CDS01 [Anthostomella pinea]|uniref:Uu.00g006570.m01.CDS01 n=1 Tax=Anthostomella pinea TaxID=933095 RepID=A0AAI8YJ13_9PEZI|nr:Uu.00g006570.m01.CDS01 [Anthostomella pinea]
MSASRHHKGSSSKSQRAATSSVPSSSSKVDYNAGTMFLFVVNEIQLDPAFPRDADEWGNERPPRQRAAYRAETRGVVFRYSNGVVSPAAGYHWRRPNGVGTEGAIGYDTQSLDASGNIVNTFRPVVGYKTCTVFDAGPFLPWVYVDVDASTHDVEYNDQPYDRFWAVNFAHQRGVSRVTSGGEKLVAGQQCSWLGSLVPESYRNLRTNPPLSEGLGGELGPLLGLMALAERHRHTNDAFSRHWSGQQWSGRRQVSVSTEGPPRGVLVHVALEPTQDPEQAAIGIDYFERHGIAVRG